MNSLSDREEEVYSREFIIRQDLWMRLWAKGIIISPNLSDKAWEEILPHQEVYPELYK